MKLKKLNPNSHVWTANQHKQSVADKNRHINTKIRAFPIRGETQIKFGPWKISSASVFKPNKYVKTGIGTRTNVLLLKKANGGNRYYKMPSGQIQKHGV